MQLPFLSKSNSYKYSRLEEEADELLPEEEQDGVRAKLVKRRLIANGKKSGFFLSLIHQIFCRIESSVSMFFLC